MLFVFLVPLEGVVLMPAVPVVAVVFVVALPEYFWIEMERANAQNNETTENIFARYCTGGLYNNHRIIGVDLVSFRDQIFKCEITLFAARTNRGEEDDTCRPLRSAQRAWSCESNAQRWRAPPSRRRAELRLQ